MSLGIHMKVFTTSSHEQHIHNEALLTQKLNSKYPDEDFISESWGNLLAA